MNGYTVLFILIIIGAITYLTVPRILVRRAADDVIWAFIEQGAVGTENARPVEKFRMPGSKFGMRDYHPMALQLLLKEDVVQQRLDGSIFLAGEKLAQSTWARPRFNRMTGPRQL